MHRFEISREAYSLLKRLGARDDAAVNFNDALAGELVDTGYAKITGEGLVPTPEGLMALRERQAPTD
jgi:hypothetical protein